MQKTKWFERKFPPIDDNGLFPCIIERLEGTPVRLNAKLEKINSSTFKIEDGTWSIKKEVGHLIDLEPLWFARMQEIIAGKQDLMEADLENTKTHETNHDEQRFFDLSNTFREHRQKLMQLLRNLSEQDLNKAAKHPRLGTPMRLIDLAFFVAEHDDHHLAQITFLGK